MKDLRSGRKTILAVRDLGVTAEAGAPFVCSEGKPLTALNLGCNMSKEYVVRPGLGNFLVLRETKDVNGKVVNVEICDTFSRMDEAQAKARLSNYIILKAREACRKLQVA